MWYSRIIVSKLTGEYWLTEDGPQFADGDTGDDNHEMLADQHILNGLGNDIEDGDWGTQTGNTAREAFDRALHVGPLVGRMPEYIAQLQAVYGDDYINHADHRDYLMWLNTHHITEPSALERTRKWTEREIKGLDDSRAHVAQHYDWVAVRGHHIEVWEMNDLTRARLKRQLEELYHEENDYMPEDYEDWKEEKAFNLSILSTGQHVSKLSYYDLINRGAKERSIQPDIPELKLNHQPLPPSYYKYPGG